MVPLTFTDALAVVVVVVVVVVVDFVVVDFVVVDFVVVVDVANDFDMVAFVNLIYRKLHVFFPGTNRKRGCP